MSEQLSRPGRFDQSEMQVVRETIAPGCSDAELMLFAKVCERTGLDPFARQIYALKRKSKDDKGNYEERLSIQTSIDGLRVIAERTTHYRGQEGPHFCGPDGEWREVWLESKPPAAARVGIIREGFDEPVRAIALYHEYVQTYNDSPTKMWKEKPTLMLAKCAEALALRKAFPNDMSGVYTEEEIPPPTDGEKAKTDLDDLKRTGVVTGRHTAPQLAPPPREPEPQAQTFIPGGSAEAAMNPPRPKEDAPAASNATPGPTTPAAAPGSGEGDADQQMRENVAYQVEHMTPGEAKAFFASLTPPLSIQTPALIRNRIGMSVIKKMYAALVDSLAATK